eukprot:1178304-Prymnesium_polylepis.1
MFGQHAYVADSGNNVIRLIIMSGSSVMTLAGQANTGTTDGTGTSALFNEPRGLTLVQESTLYVADKGNHKIRRISLSTRAVTTLAGTGAAGTADGTGTAAAFDSPVAVTANMDGTQLYVCERSNRIRLVVLATSVVTTFAGSSGSLADGVGTSATFDQPHGIAIHPSSLYLFVADKDNNVIRAIAVRTSTVTTLAGDQSQSPSVTDGTGTNARFDGPYDLDISVDGQVLYVTDSNGHALRRVEVSTKVVTTVAGSMAGSSDGVGAAASFNQPMGVA